MAGLWSNTRRQAILYLDQVLIFNLSHMTADIQKPRRSPRDLFLHFLAMFTLYISAISLTTVLYQIINILVPDTLAGIDVYSANAAERILRMALSFLIVMLPVCVYSIMILNKTYVADPQKAVLPVRKAIIYFTLFVVSFIIMFSLVFLLNSFLQGELTLRFFLKLLSVLFVAGSIFGYYRWELKQFRKEESSIHE